MCKVTIFTPTFNRGKLLKKLYESLKEQSEESFEWLIIDDGSKDNTKSIVKEFLNENKIKIRYYKQKNSGKHIAINNGTDLARGELFFIVDSDDYITKDAVKLISNMWKDIEDKAQFIGVSGKRILNGKSRDFKFQGKYFDANAIDFNLKYKNIQDKAEVFHTEKLKKYKFKKFENENFITEAVIWYKMAEDGFKIRWFNENIYVGEYLEDGLTQNSYKQRIKNINGTCYAYNKLSSYNLPVKYRIKYKINYFRFGFSKYDKRKLNNELYDKKFKNISMCIGKILYMLDQAKENRND